MKSLTILITLLFPAFVLQRLSDVMTMSSVASSLTSPEAAGVDPGQTGKQCEQVIAFGVVSESPVFDEVRDFVGKWAFSVLECLYLFFDVKLPSVARPEAGWLRVRRALEETEDKFPTSIGWFLELVGLCRKRADISNRLDEESILMRNKFMTLIAYCEFDLENLDQLSNHFCKGSLHFQAPALLAVSGYDFGFQAVDFDVTRQEGTDMATLIGMVAWWSDREANAGLKSKLISVKNKISNNETPSQSAIVSLGRQVSIKISPYAAKKEKRGNRVIPAHLWKLLDSDHVRKFLKDAQRSDEVVAGMLLFTLGVLTRSSSLLHLRVAQSIATVALSPFYLTPLLLQDHLAFKRDILGNKKPCNNPDRVVPLPPAIMLIFRDFMGRHIENESFHDRDLMFVNTRGQQMSCADGQAAEEHFKREYQTWSGTSCGNLGFMTNKTGRGFRNQATGPRVESQEYANGCVPDYCLTLEQKYCLEVMSCIRFYGELDITEGTCDFVDECAAVLRDSALRDAKHMASAAMLQLASICKKLRIPFGSKSKLAQI